MILPRDSKSRSVTLLTDWMTSDKSGCRASFETMFSFKASKKVMKFSVAVRIRLPEAPPAGALVGRPPLGVWAPWDACSTVAGKPIRRRSVARGHSN